MHTEQIRYAAAAKRKNAKKKEPILKNVVSLRVSDQEKRLLDRLTAATSKNVSDLVREALGFWLAKGRRRSGASTKKRTLGCTWQATEANPT